MGRATNRVCLTVLALWVGSAAIVRAGDFPYRARIRTGEAAPGHASDRGRNDAPSGGQTTRVDVHGGPGDDYYATGQLPLGAVVEVYRHDRGGWCAIRPPDGSFSWVLEKYLSFAAGDGSQIAEVTSDRCQAHVGTALGSERDVRQVQLSVGEQVQVLERGDPWCKIAPPAGEFRWVRARYLEPLDESDDAPRGPSASPADSRRATRAAAGIEQTAGEGRDEHAREERARDTKHPRAAERSADDALHDDRPIERRLATLELELSAMVAHETNDWELGELAERAKDLAEEAEKQGDRDQAQELARRIGKFADLQKRHAQLQAELETLRPAAALSGSRTGRNERANPRTLADTRYDGVGRLQPVARRGPHTPQYALVDESGGVLAYVNPGPGVNLAAFQNREVGVNGVRNFISSIRKPLITAQRVTLLSDEGALRR